MRAQVRLYRNGDAHFAGMSYPVSAERYRTLDALLEDLTRSIVCDRTVLPQGVRFLFAVDSGRRVTALEQLEDGASYVCSTRPLYRRIDYTRIGSVGLYSSRSNHQVSLRSAGLYFKQEQPRDRINFSSRSLHIQVLYSVKSFCLSAVCLR